MSAWPSRRCRLQVSDRRLERAAARDGSQKYNKDQMRRGIAAAMAGRLQGSGPCWLAASGTRYMLYPGEFVPQPVGRVKRFSTSR